MFSFHEDGRDIKIIFQSMNEISWNQPYWAKRLKKHQTVTHERRRHSGRCTDQSLIVGQNLNSCSINGGKRKSVVKKLVPHFLAKVEHESIKCKARFWGLSTSWGFSMQHLGASYGFSVGVLMSICGRFVGFSRPISSKKLDGAVLRLSFSLG